jgi:hypothetical protein
MLKVTNGGSVEEHQENVSVPEDTPVENETPTEASPPETTPEATPLPIKKSRKKLIIMVASLLVLLLAAGATFMLLSKDKPAPAPVKKSVVTKAKTTAAASPIFATAKSLGDLALVPKLGDECRSLGNSDCPSPSAVKYYQFGLRADGTKLIIMTAPSEGPNLRGKDTYVGTFDTAGKVTLYGQSAQYADSIIDKAKVTIDISTFPAELTFPKNITLKDEPLKRGIDSNDAGFFIDGLSDYAPKGKAPAKIASFDGKDYYDVVVSDNDNFAVHEVFGAVTTVYAVSYRQDGLLDSSKAPELKLTDGTFNQDTFTASGPGCGSAYGYMVPKNLDTSSLIKAGTDASGAAVYQLPTTNAFFQEVYTKDYANGDYLDAKYKGMTKDQFQAAHGILVSKNGLGQYVAYLNQTLIQGGGCAKPVVYLYPTRTTDVSVQVGALVSKSDPLYSPANGWQHVTAQSSGALSYQGKAYGSLFWEGIGLGAYPNVSSGTVVPSSAAVATIRQQLAAQGLNNQESNDFLAYWQDKLPATPFVRLSWLTTDELNTLAPLKITPTPQTVIRTFLDFQGLNLPISLAPQTFHTPARNGFTVVEWGGLLH